MCGGGSDKNLGTASLIQAQSQAAISQQQLALATEKQASDTALQREYLDLIQSNRPLEQRVQTAQAESMEAALARQRDVQNPLEDQLIEEARSYDSLERQGLEAGKADSAVVQAYDKATAGAQRDMLRSGLNPNSAKALAMRENASVAQAATAANASSAATEAVKGKGFAMRMDAAALGRNLSSNSVAAADSSLRAGQSAASSMGNVISSANQSFGSTMSGFGSAAGTAGNSASTYQAIANQQQSAANTKNAGIGAALGTAAGMYASSAAGGAALSAVGAGLMTM